jgi:hypothetical protein
LTCWELVRQLAGKDDYEEQCVKLNFSLHAFPYNGSQTEIFSNDDAHEIMDSYFHLLITVFDVTNKVQLCLIAVKNQVISLFGGEANFNLYLADKDGKFISATNDEKKYITCCHQEALLNPKYRNTNTPGNAIIWDEMYTLICSFFGNSESCQEAANIINAAGGTHSFELMKHAAHDEKNKRNSERLLDLSASGQHPFQQPELIERNRHSLLDMSAIGQHPWQQPEFTKRNRDHLLDLSAIGQHPWQQPELIKRHCDCLLDLSDIGQHPWQLPELIEHTRDRLLDLSAIGQHPWQHRT